MSEGTQDREPDSCKIYHGLPSYTLLDLVSEGVATAPLRCIFTILTSPLITLRLDSERSQGDVFVAPEIHRGGTLAVRLHQLSSHSQGISPLTLVRLAISYSNPFQHIAEVRL